MDIKSNYNYIEGIEEFNLQRENEQLEKLSAEERIQWAVNLFARDVVLLSSMQKTASVLMYMFYRLNLDNEILFVDTGYHFIETLKLRDEFLRKYRLNIITLYPELTIEEQEQQYKEKLYMSVKGQPICCNIRKVKPFLNYLSATKNTPVVINGLRRIDGGNRKNILPISRDPRTGGFSLSPIFDWTDEMINAYIEKYNLLIHPLYQKNYTSIGCATCTTPVLEGEDPRAGRWRHLRQTKEGKDPTYCGINYTDGGGI